MVTFLARYASPWTEPVLYGLAAFAAVSVGILCLRQMGRLSKARTTFQNVEAQVRTWLNNFRVAVQNDPSPEAYFRVIATMASGAKIIVGRPKGEFSDYIIFRSEITPTPQEQATIANLPDEEVERLLSEIRLELARATVGYSGLARPITTVVLFKRVPIGEALTEDLFISKLDEMEAVLNVIAIISWRGFSGARRIS